MSRPTVIVVKGPLAIGASVRLEVEAREDGHAAVTAVGATAEGEGKIVAAIRNVDITYPEGVTE